MIRADERIPPTKTGISLIVTKALEDLDAMAEEVADADENRVLWLLFQLSFTAPTRERMLRKANTVVDVASALARAGVAQPDIGKFALEALSNAITPTSSSSFIVLRTPVRNPQKFMEAYTRLYARLGRLMVIKLMRVLVRNVTVTLDYIVSSLSPNGEYILQRPSVVKSSLAVARRTLVMAYGLAEVLDSMTKARAEEPPHV